MTFVDFNSKGEKGLNSRYSPFNILLWYFFFGACHELSHVAVAFYFDVFDGAMHPDESYTALILRVVLGRAIDLPALADADESVSSLVRHIGWICSSFLAVAMVFAGFDDSSIASAAIVTAVEALATDFFKLGTNGKTMMLCGNFGLILINPSWISDPDNGITALKILQKLVEITMMRGAQTGGVVTWTKKSGRGELSGIRSRVVNGKRTDLSNGVVSKVYRDAFARGKVKPGIRGFFGHTRFATSSKATLEGCHPHQWSAPHAWNVYGLDVYKSSSPTPRSVKVENFITHNGDLDFFRVGTKFYDLHAVQQWLEKATGFPMPATVDSAAIAGLVDIIRTAGSFGLSARFAFLLGSKSSVIDSACMLPSRSDFHQVGKVFETALAAFCKDKGTSIHAISGSSILRSELAAQVIPLLVASPLPMIKFVDGEESGSGMTAYNFANSTIDAFLDNDLFQTTKYFLENAKGSFGLMFTCSLDANDQICIAARGQTMSLALYPRKGIICYGSEQAAVKAGLNFEAPSGDVPYERSTTFGSEKYELETVRIDLDDLGGEVCLVDWSGRSADDTVSYPNRHRQQHVAFHGKVRLVFHQQSKASDHDITKRFTLLEGNEFINPLPNDSDDLILADIRDIPKICKEIQGSWGASSLNCLTAWNFTRCLRRRLQARVNEKASVHAGTVDILLTGCEVSLWLAEQFAADLQKAFPKLFIKAVSSNKLLGVFGQELSIPCAGYPLSQTTNDLSDTIVLVVSHSGGTFAPLACSNLLQSKTQNMFVVTSEWDTQIGKQLRSMSDGMLSSRIFTTNVGVRPAEPCSLSVAATHQLLTQLFQQIATAILSNPDFRRVSGAAITDSDVQILERCNRDNIQAMESITGGSRYGGQLPAELAEPEIELREAGKLWSDHILENARALIMSFVYVVATVTAGYPLITGITIACGVTDKNVFYGTRFLDSLIYFFLPQINVTILRIIQGRNLRHRMVGRTVVIGDIPWVSQAADAFLSKIFACSYSIAGLNVLSGNPTDHLVHRHTHRVVRGSLLVCGRPDGRLMSLTSAEATVCLSTNQASSIQSIGGTCESVTIGHNPSKMALTKNDIFLPTHRPKFLCERLLMDEHFKALDSSRASFNLDDSQHTTQTSYEQSSSSMNTSPHFLLGTYMTWAQDAQRQLLKKNNALPKSSRRSHYEKVVDAMIQETSESRRLKPIFDSIDVDGNGTLDRTEFTAAYKKYNPDLSDEDIETLFESIDLNGSGIIDFHEFVAAAKLPQSQMVKFLDVVNRSDRHLNPDASTESYFGEHVRNKAPSGTTMFSLCESQSLVMELYESRIASLQRFIAMTVMFHEMGHRVQQFFPRVSCGYLGYRMDRTHSIMRIATTASPVSGSDVRERMDTIKLKITIKKAVSVISAAWYTYRQKESRRLLYHAKSEGKMQRGSQKKVVLNVPLSPHNDAATRVVNVPYTDPMAAHREYKSMIGVVKSEEDSGIFS